MNSLFGKILRNLRNDKRISQQELAKICNTTKYTISAWELGKQEPNIDNIVLLAKYFNVSTDYLLGLED